MLSIEQVFHNTTVGVEGLVCQQSIGRIGIANTKFFFACLFIALALATTTANAQLSDRWSCIGNCNVAIPNGDVSSPPSGNSTYEFITTSGAPWGQGQIQGVGGTNGSNLKLFIPNVNAGDNLEFNFNYVTSDGAGFSDYAWAGILNTNSQSISDYLFTARTVVNGNTSPGFGLPLNSATLTPSTSAIIPHATNWSALGDYSSGYCFAVGCGSTGWIHSSYTVLNSGSLNVVFGVSNWLDTSYDSGLAIDEITLNNNEIVFQSFVQSNNLFQTTIDQANSFYLASNLGGTVLPVFEGGTLRIDNAATYAGNFTLDTSVTNTIDANGRAAVFSGIFSDATAGGNIIIADGGGGGVITFSNANTYTGSTTIQAGATLALSGNGSIAQSATVYNAGTIDISQTTAGASLNNLIADGSVILGAKNLTLLYTPYLKGTAANFSGAGSVILPSHQSTGVFVVSFGGALNNTGDLIIGDFNEVYIGSPFGNNTAGSVVGNIQNSGFLGFSRTDTSTYSGVISGSGTVNKVNAGTIIFTAANTYTGATRVASGSTLALSGAGGIASSSSLLDSGIFDISATTSGASVASLSGIGSVVLGAQTLTLTAANDTFSGVIGGTGGLIIAAGTETLSGTNTYTGGTTVNTGATLVGTTTSLQGAIADAGTLTFNQSTSGTYAGVISGAGSVSLSGTGTVTLSGANTYTGGTTVTGGTLVVTGKIGAVAVTNGTLQGTGTVGTTTIATGSTLSPGVNGAPGILNISGNLTMAAGANYAVAVTPTAASKVIVSGSSNVDGAVTATFAAGNYIVGQKFAIVESTGLVTGSFASLTHAGAALPVYLTDNLSYTSNYVYLNIAPKYLTPVLPTVSPSNLTNTATAIDAAVTAGGIPTGGMLAFYSQTGAALAGSITQAEGQVGANVSTAVTQSFAPFLKTMTDQCATGSDQDASTSCVWGSVYGGHTGIAANVTTGAASLSGSNVGLAMGGQQNAADGSAVLGVSVAIGQQTFSSGNGTGISHDLMFGLYGYKSILDHGYISGSLGYANLDVTTTRTLTVAGTDVLTGKVHAQELGGRVEGGYHVSLDNQSRLTPYLAGSLQNIVTPAYAEGVQSGTSSFALSYLAQNNTLSHTEAGAHLDRSFQLDDDTNLTAQYTIGWSHQLDYSPVSSVSFQSLSGSSFKLNGIKPANDTAVLGLNLQAQKAKGLSYGVRVDSQIGPGTTIIEAAGNVAYRW